MCTYSCIFSELILREISNGLSFRVLEQENRKAPNQHRLFVPCPKKRSTPALLLSLSTLSTSTPKPRAEGSSPSAPAKNREASTMLASLFFVSAHKDSATRHGCALRSACRGVSERQWRSAANRPRRQPRPSPSAPAKKPAKTLGFRRFSFCTCCMVIWCILVRTPGFPIRSHPSPTVSILSSTQNAPDFGCFRMNSGASLFFCWFSGIKFSTSFLSTLPIWFTSRSRW